jgi:hypothetical protein
MADNKNNLEDFFNNRINDFDESNDGWDLPDESAWENAQAHFPNQPQKKTWNWKLGVLILLVFTLFSAGVYIYFLKKDLVNKSNEIEIAKNEIENKNNTITNLEKEISKVESELKKEKLNTQNVITSLTQKEQILTQTIFSQKKKNQFLSKENQKNSKELISTQSNFASKNESNFPINEKIASNYTIKDSKMILENLIPIASSFMEIQNIFPTQKLDLESEFNVFFPTPKKKKGKFEIGVNYTSLNLKIPLSYDFEKLEKEDFGKKNWSFPVQTKGGEFYLAYKVRPKLWITTGLRRTTGGFEKTFSDKLIYDKSGEYIDGDGKTINEFEITTQTGFSDAGSSIDFEIPSGTNIDDGDFLETEWNYSQQYKFIHIPIGVNYLMGKNKLKLFLTGGFGWNKVSLGEYFVEAQLSYDNEILPIKRNEESKKNEVSSQFINGFAGVGLNYQLTSSWKARTSFTMEKNFIQKDEILETNSLSKVFDIGLSYRF